MYEEQYTSPCGISAHCTSWQLDTYIDITMMHRTVYQIPMRYVLLHANTRYLQSPICQAEEKSRSKTLQVTWTTMLALSDSDEMGLLWGLALPAASCKKSCM